MKKMIKADKITKIYGTTKALENFTCNISGPEVVGLLGANGAGKSTLMKILTGCISPTSGNASICGFDIFSDLLKVKKNIGYLPEKTPLYENMRVQDYLYYVANLKHVVSSLKKEHIQDIIDKTGLHLVSQQKILKLSKGYRQRVGLAQALIGDPSVLIIDEPTSGLDPVQIKETRNLLKHLGTTKTILISTHILSEVEQICNSVIILHNGKVVLQGNMKELLYKNEIFISTDAKLDAFKQQIRLLEEVQEVTQESQNLYKIKLLNGDPRKKFVKFVGQING